MCYNFGMNVENISEFPTRAQDNCRRCDAHVGGRCKLAELCNFNNYQTLTKEATDKYLALTHTG